MFDRLKMLYKEGRVSADGIKKAIGKGWITEAEAEEIIGE